MAYQNITELLEAEHNGYKVTNTKNFGPFEADSHLMVALAYNPSKDESVVWTYNSSTDGFVNGAYFKGEIPEEAFNCFWNRGNWDLVEV